MTHKMLSFLALGMMLFGAGCGALAAEPDPVFLTVTPMSEIVRGTATARAANEGGSGDELATAVFKATERSQQIYATQTARASMNDESRLATATAIAPVVAELPRYGIDAGQGYVAWMHAPATITLEGPQQQGYVNDYPQITARDFVMAADITWNTRNSTYLCGFMFRSNGDQAKPSQYIVSISRIAMGYAAFLATVNGEIGNFQTFYPRSQDRSFEWGNDTTNRLVVVARGPLIDIYTNGIFIGQVDASKPPPTSLQTMPAPQLPSGASDQQRQQYQVEVDEYNRVQDQINGNLADAKRNFAELKPVLTDGLLGFVGISQSGSMTCKYENAWLFILEP